MRRPWLIAFVLAVAGVTVLLWWPFPTCDLAKVHPSLRDLQKPYRSVRADSYLDGGSVGVEIVGADGTILQFAFPVRERANGSPRFPQLFVGGLYVERKPGRPPLNGLTDSSDTRAMLIRLVETDARYGADRCAALMSLRSAPKDHLALALYMLWGRHHSNGR